MREPPVRAAIRDVQSMNAVFGKWFALMENKRRSTVRFRPRMGAVWFLLFGMLICCGLLLISPFPDPWKPLQNFAAILQAFLSGLAVAQWLPIWEAEPPGGERRTPSTD